MRNSVFLVLCFGLFSSYQVLAKPNPATDEDLEDYNNDDVDDTDDATRDPVSIISQPRNFTINIGSTVKLPCHLNGDIDEATVAWKFGTSPLFFHLQRQTANNRTTIAKDFTVTIEHAKPEDSGTYECTVLGEVIPGQDIVIHRVAVVSSPRIIQVIPTNIVHEVTPGAPFTFMCDAVGTPTPQIFWIKQLKGSNSTETIKDSKISYDKVESSHSGKYTCVARNKNGEDSKSIEFVVLSPPVITPLRPVVATSKGYESELICKSEPNVSPPQVHWLKDGHRIKNDNRYTVTVDNNSMDRQYILRIAATKEEDYGTYECFGKNTYGESIAKVELTGKPLKPVFVNGNPKENGHELTFFIESKIGFENYEMAYKRQQDDEWETSLSKYSSQSNAVELTHAFSQDLTPDTYEAKIRVQNANGWSEWSDVQYFPGRKGGRKSNDVVQSKLLESSVVRGAASSLCISTFLPLLSTVALYSMLHWNSLASSGDQNEQWYSEKP